MRAGPVLALIALLSTPAFAQTAGANPDYSPDDFVKAILTGPQPCPPGKSLEACEANPKTRRFSLATQKPSAPANAAAPQTARTLASNSGLPKAPPRPRTVTSANILVTFATGSAEITPAGQANLKSVAAGLNRPALAALHFEVAGYTDVTGAADLNADLSRRRAEAVKTYLAALSVDPSRLVTVGYGAEHLANPGDPTAEENRRVELHRLN
jgi:outer membrane protein OmpA-like peptidoglycan-associated protein